MTKPIRVYTITTAATALGISADHLRRLADEGTVPVAALTVGSDIRLFNADDISFLAQERAAAARSRQPHCDS